jgi:glyoxylase-like metal-dependent hydrolase (beta-lactamase superfamily II)
MIHEVLSVGMLQVNCSVCGDEATREAFVFDPGEEAERILDVVKRHGLKVAGIVLTHAHIDHIGGVREVQQATGAPVSLHPADRALAENAEAHAAMLGLSPPGHFDVDTELADGDVLRLGAIEFRVLHTPGHTQGGCCFLIPSEGRLIAGDTLFRDSIGRTDLPGGNGPQLLESIREKLFPLPDDTVVIPGHGPQTTIGHERESNVFLQGL